MPDALRALHPDGRIYTFWKYLRNTFAGVDRDVHGWEHTSDHAAAWVKFK